MARVFHVRSAIYNKVYSLSPPDISQKPYYRRDNAHNEEGCPRSEYGQRRSSYFFFFPSKSRFCYPDQPNA